MPAKAVTQRQLTPHRRPWTPAFARAPTKRKREPYVRFTPPVVRTDTYHLSHPSVVFPAKERVKKLKYSWISALPFETAASQPPQEGDWAIIRVLTPNDPAGRGPPTGR